MMSVVEHAAAAPDAGRVAHASVLRLGAAVSIVQSALFVVIGVAAMVLGVDRLVDDGFASLATAEPAAFRVLCAGFVGIALLGLAITPAEWTLVAPADAGWARFGAALAQLGHAGTIAFFSWWLLAGFDTAPPGVDLDAIAPIRWGVGFELVLVSAWVWVIAALARDRTIFPAGFVALSVVKATCFWFTFAAFLVEARWMLVAGLAAVTFVAGPAWHLWIARLFGRRDRGERDAG